MPRSKINPKEEGDRGEGPSKYLFVLGAGASAELSAEFPVGEQLKNQIADLLAGELPRIPEPNFDGPEKLGPIAIAYIKEHRTTRGLREAMNQIMHSVHDHGSIDDLLDDWKDRHDMQFVAKVAIAQIIANAEQKSDVHALNIFNEPVTQRAFSNLSSTWLGGLTRSFLKSRFSRRRLHEALESAVFINFNYDRSLVGSLRNSVIVAVIPFSHCQACEMPHRIES